MIPERAQAAGRRRRRPRRNRALAVALVCALASLLGALVIAALGVDASWRSLRRVGGAFEGVVESRAFLSAAFVFAWSGAFLAVMCGVLTLARSPGRRGALAPVVGGAMLAVGVLDALHALSIVWWFDVAHPTPRAEDGLWHTSRVLFAGSLALAGAMALARWRASARTALPGMAAVAIASFAVLLAVALERPGEASALRSPRWIALALTIGAFVFAGAALRNSWRRSRSLLALGLALSVIPHIAADLAFALSHVRGGSAAFTAAMGLRMLGYLTAAIAVAAETARSGWRALSLERRLQAATRCALDGVWEWPDVASPKQRWSPRLYELLGYGAGKVSASRDALLALAMPEHQDKLRCALERAASAETAFEVDVQLRQRSGEARWFRVRGEALRDDAADRLGMVGVIADIEAEMLVKDELAFQKRALDEHAIVAITDAKGTITYANDKFCQISKYSRDELIGQNHRIVNSGYHDKQFFKGMYATIGRGRVWRGEIRNRAKDGSIYWVDTTIVPMLDAAGKVQSYVAVRADITARKRTERELELKNEQMEQFVYTVSHDLKTPIVTLKGYVGWLEEDLREGRIDDMPRCAMRIREAAQRMESLVQDLLELSRAGRQISEGREADLTELARNVAAEHEAEARERGLRIEIVDALPAVVGDAKRLRDVLDNLVGNAVKYGWREGGGEIRVGARTVGDEVRVFVADDGPGVEPRHHERIFSVFERLANDSEGTGVGLAIVRRVMEAHGGRAWVESTPGRGATFWLAFPRSAALEVRVAAPAPSVAVAA